MEKNLTGLTIIFMIMLSNSVFGQDSKKGIESEVRKNFMPSIRKLAAMENRDVLGTQILKRNEINIWAVRDFLNRFEKMEDVQWFSFPDGGLEAYFIQDGYGDRVFYTNRGDWKSSLLIYNEDKLPRDIRAVVKSVYFDLNIFLAEEIHTREGVEYVVHLEDKSTIIIVKVNQNDELEVLKELTKQ